MASLPSLDSGTAAAAPSLFLFLLPVLLVLPVLFELIVLSMLPLLCCIVEGFFTNDVSSLRSKKSRSEVGLLALTSLGFGRFLKVLAIVNRGLTSKNFSDQCLIVGGAGTLWSVGEDVFAQVWRLP